MTAEQWAAWVSAAAAVVQAFGSVAAIFYAVRIARAGDARAAAAERAAEERAIRAEIQALERSGTALLNREREVADTASALADEVLKETSTKIEEYRKRVTENATFMGTFDPAAAKRLSSLTPELRSRAVKPELMLAIEALAVTCMSTTGVSQSQSASGWIEHLTRFAAKVEAARDAVRAAAPLGARPDRESPE